MYKKQLAFSLIELLVAVSIVAVITAVAFGSLSGLQKSGRDTQRQADLRMLQGALQQYYANENHYPDFMALNAGAALSASGRTYLTTTPKDPLTGTATPYCYTSYLASGNPSGCAGGGAAANLCHYYKLYAQLENSGAGALSCGAVNTYNFQVAPL